MNPYLVNNLKISCELILSSINKNDNIAPATINNLIRKIPQLTEHQLLEFKNLFLDSKLQPLIPVLINTTNASAQELGFELRDHIAAISSQKKENNSNGINFNNFPTYTTRFPIGKCPDGANIPNPSNGNTLKNSNT